MRMRNVYSVGQVNHYVKNMFTQDYFLQNIYIKGEVSNCKYHSSGHIYFSLKDESGTLSCIMFAGSRKGLAFRMKDGDKVVAGGRIDVFERDGRYQFYPKEITLEGEGILYQRYLALKQELEEMGMFAAEYKQPVPQFAARVGVVTSPTGAAVKDIANVSARRNPFIQTILYPALVQGEGAAECIAEGIRCLDEFGVDIIIVGRGGGSIEELWAFNEEVVARAIFECRTPVISAVGHETDFTIADFVADLRAPTPSAAAELAYFDCRSFLEAMQNWQNRMERAIWNKTDVYRARLEQYQTRLNYLKPESRMQQYQQELVLFQDRLQNAMEQKIQEKRYRLSLCLERLHGLSPLRKLNQGYAYVSDEEGKAVTHISQAAQGDSLLVYVTDGVIETVVRRTRKEERDLE